MPRCKLCKITINKGKEIVSGINKFCSKRCRLDYQREQIRKEKEKQLKKQKIEKTKEKKIIQREKKRTTFTKLVKELDSIFSKYIRNKHSINGKCTCISCGQTLEISQAQNCHWINRGTRLYRWSEDNCRPGCSACNLFNKEFHLREYTIKLIDELGIEKINEMRFNSKQVGEKPNRFDLMEKLQFYKQKLKEYESI